MHQLNPLVLRRAVTRLDLLGVAGRFHRRRDDFARFEPMFLSVLVDNLVQGVLSRVSSARLQAHIIVAELGFL